ncbi:MAG: flagellar export protein FliJ [Lachnospiraceae bacterium]|nr:flagellar export protein FliJ [Lachnospiraceae bacterium]
MAKFRYRMQSILDIKEKIESQEKIAYSQANAELQVEQDKLTKLMIRRAGYERDLKAATVGDLDFNEIKRLKAAIETMKVLVREQMMNVHIAEKRVEEARARLDAVMKERKTHENLKEKAFEEFKAEMNAEENKVTDELVSYTYGKNEDGEE